MAEIRPARALSALAALTLALLTLTGCGKTDAPTYQGVCVDPRTQVRLDDDACSSDHSSGTSSAVMMWLLLSSRGNTYSSTYVAPVGSHIDSTSYVRTLPASARLAPAPAPRSGGWFTPPPPKQAVPADRWIERNPQYRGRIVQDKPAVKPQDKPARVQQPGVKPKPGGPAAKPRGGGWGGGAGKAGGSKVGGYRR